MFGIETLQTSLLVLLIICVICVCIFEFINGFHDTANAVATVIYTNSLRPQAAVILSGVLNFFGVFVGGIGVAIGIINLLPTEALVQSDVWQSMAMILALLLTAIIWNLGTWWLGIPCSSSHTLIGSILGVGIAIAGLEGVNWGKAAEVGASLLISPIIGLSLAAMLMFLLRALVKNDKIFQAPDGRTPPPWWIRIILIATCSGVSFSHGSNDGQKGVGLMMLVLISILPLSFALNHNYDIKDYKESLGVFQAKLNEFPKQQPALQEAHNRVNQLVQELNRNELTKEQVIEVRTEIIYLDKNLKKIFEKDPQAKAALETSFKEFKAKTIEYAPKWVIVVIALCLGIGTMIGWKRIVVTIGEKIGKTHLTYAQGASAEMIATLTIGFSSFVHHLPVSTTHILSSGVAGTMIAQNGAKGLQKGTIRSIIIAWLLTLPVCIILAAGLYWILSKIM